MTKRKKLTIEEVREEIRASNIIKETPSEAELRELFVSNPEEKRRRDDEKAREYSWRIVQGYWGPLPVRYCYKHNPEITFVKPASGIDPETLFPRTKDPRKLSAPPKGVRDDARCTLVKPGKLGSDWIGKNGKISPIENDTTTAILLDSIPPKLIWASRMGSGVMDSFEKKNDYTVGTIVGARKPRDRRPDYRIGPDASGVLKIPKKDRPDAGPNMGWYALSRKMEREAREGFAKWKLEDPEAWEAFHQGEDTEKKDKGRDPVWSKSLIVNHDTAPGGEADPFAPLVNPRWDNVEGGFGKDGAAYIEAMLDDEGPGSDPLAGLVDEDEEDGDGEES